MNWLDIIIVVIVVIAIFTGLRTGIIKMALSLAGLIVGVILAGRYYISLSEQLFFIPQADVAEGVAFAVILIGVMVITSILAALLRWIASAIMLGWVNHLGGAVLGLVLGVMLCSALLAIWVKFFGVDKVITESSVTSMLLDRFPAVLALLPEEFDMIRSFFQ